MKPYEIRARKEVQMRCPRFKEINIMITVQVVFHLKGEENLFPRSFLEKGRRRRRKGRGKG